MSGFIAEPFFVNKIFESSLVDEREDNDIVDFEQCIDKTFIIKQQKNEILYIKLPKKKKYSLSTEKFIKEWEKSKLKNPFTKRKIVQGSNLYNTLSYIYSILI
jgi:hypothetical protein